MQHVKQQLACHTFKQNNTIIVNPPQCKVHIVGTDHCINTDYIYIYIHIYMYIYVYINTNTTQI